MLKILKIDHVGVATSDIEAAKKFFGEILGMEVHPDINIRERSLRICFITAGKSGLEFVMPTSSNTPLAEHIDQHGEGAYHLALEVSNIKKSLIELNNAKVPLVDKTARFSKIGAKVAFLEQGEQTTEVSVELVERIK